MPMGNAFGYLKKAGSMLPGMSSARAAKAVDLPNSKYMARASKNAAKFGVTDANTIRNAAIRNRQMAVGARYGAAGVAGIGMMNNTKGGRGSYTGSSSGAGYGPMPMTSTPPGSGRYV